MTMQLRPPWVESDLLALVRPRVERSIAASEAFFAREGPTIARCAAAMAHRFVNGGRLLIFRGGHGAADPQHHAVEYVHPVTPACRALPAISLGTDVSTARTDHRGSEPASVFARNARLLGRSSDIALAFDEAVPTPAVEAGLLAASDLGMLTVALLAGGGARERIADFQFAVETADPGVAEEVHLATSHILRELVSMILKDRDSRVDERPRVLVFGDERTGIRCATCLEVLTRVVVERVDGDRATVLGKDGGDNVIGLDLVDGVRVGEALLVHGGVAVQRAGETTPSASEQPGATSAPPGSPSCPPRC